MMDYREGAAGIAINRPERVNACRGQPCDEPIDALQREGVRAFQHKRAPDFRRWAK